MMKQILVMTLVLLLVAGTGLYPQSATSQFGVFGVLSMPSGDFAADDLEESSGLAKTGFGAGVSYTLPLGTEGLGWHTDVAVIFNGVDESSIEDEGLDVKGGQWRNIPIMSGLRYTSEVSPTMKLFAVGQLALTLVQGPTLEISEAGEDDWEDLEIGSGTTFGFGIGAGLIFNDKFNLSARYLSLGKTELDIKMDNVTIEDAEYEPSISMIIFTAGITF